MFVRFSELFERVKSGKRAQYDGHFEAVSCNTDQDCLDVIPGSSDVTLARFGRGLGLREYR